jgi:galactokinase
LLNLAGALLDASHQSLRDDHEVTVRETDLAAAAARASGAFGARMTGGGFGGSVIALVNARDVNSIASSVAAGFAALRLNEPAFMVATPSDAAGRDL